MAEAEVSDRVATVRRALAWILIAQLVVLALTGAYLVFAYRPTPTQAWGPLAAEAGEIGGRPFGHSVRTAHRWIAWSMVLPALVLAAVSFGEAMARWTGPAPRRIGALAGPLVAVLAVLALVSGFVLPWDQVALKAVTVGADFRGYWWLLGDDVRFVLRDGLELSVTTMRGASAVHVLVVPSVLTVALLALVWRNHRTSSPD